MKKMWEMIKELTRVLCIAVFFPGVELNFDAINHYFGINAGRKYLTHIITCGKALLQRMGNWQQETGVIQQS